MVFIDTGFHFAQTFRILESVEDRYGLEIQQVQPTRPRINGMYREDPDGCCARHKVEAFDTTLADHRCWVSGLRRSGSALRSMAPVVSRDRRDVVKVNPIAIWTDHQIRARIAERRLPEHPLFAHGYQSIGCASCTVPGSMSREGRWVTSSKTECGLHW